MLSNRLSQIAILCLFIIFLAACAPVREQPPARPVPAVQPVVEQPPAVQPKPVEAQPPAVQPKPAGLGELQVAFLDVAQGGAVLIVTPDNKYILYDCGEYDDIILSNLEAWNIDHIDLMITSHPHNDHMGACADVIEAMPVGRVVDNGEFHDTQTYRRYIALAETKEHTIIEKDGFDDEFPFIEYIVAYDDWGEYKSNEADNSLLVKIKWGEKSFLLTGDCEIECEETVTDTADINVDVLNVGHHGSKEASTEYALEEITPEISIISVGPNSYGHPTAEALERLEATGTQIYRTDQHGTIIVTTDGTTTKVETSEPTS